MMIMDFDESETDLELPFGDKISAVDGGYATNDNAMDTTQSHGVSLSQDFTDACTSCEASEESEDIELVDADGTDGQEDQLTPLQYARSNGLTVDYFKQCPLHSALVPTPPNSVLADLDIDERSAECLIGGQGIKQQAGNERWDVDKETAELLASVSGLARTEDLDDGMGETSLGSLKIDEPVMASVPEFDVARLRARNTVHITMRGMQHYPLDTEKGESLLWSSHDLDLPSAINETIATEKLDLDRDTVKCLQNVMTVPEVDFWDTVEQVVSESEASFTCMSSRTTHADWLQSRNVRRATTPLLPLSPPLSPIESQNEAHNMELTSSPEDLFAPEIARVEAQIFGESDPVHSFRSMHRSGDHDQNTSDEIRGMTRTPATSSSSPLRQKRLRGLKADTPLLQDEFERSPVKRSKTVSFPEELYTMIPDPSSGGSLADLAATHQHFTDFVYDVVAPLAQSVMDEIDNEKLDELDTTLRATVPGIETIKPTPPWRSAENDGYNAPTGDHTPILSQIQKEIPENRKKWSGVSKLERLLPWTPFPRYLGKVSADEQFDDGSCERYMAEMRLSDSDGSIDSLLWKPDSLRLLDAHDSDDEDLETANVQGDNCDAEHMAGESEGGQAPEPPALQAAQTTESEKPATTRPDLGRTGMQALLERRKLELQTSRDRGQAGFTRADSRKKETTTVDMTMRGLAPSLATNGLHTFLGLQGAQIADTARPSLPPPKAGAAVPLLAAAVQEPPNTLPSAPARLLPIPMLQSPSQKMSVIVATSMLANRQLVRQVQTHLPNLDMIERDSAQLVPQSETPARSGEADFTLSSSTVLICTTLQKLKQRPLPGQQGFFGVRDRIALTSLQCERCIILVGEGKQVDELSITAPDERDAAAISGLIAFTNSLESSVEVCYVPGGDAELSKWVAANICRYRCTDEVVLLHDETMWEHLLRRAGANPIAAQLMLGKLKHVESVEGSGSSPNSGSTAMIAYGLSAFVQMTAEERVQRFGPFMGGENILARVSEVVDRGWMPAAV